MPTKTTTPSRCPACAHDLVLLEAGALSWCPACQWNLDVYDPALAPWRGTTLIGRWGFRRGLELDRATHEDLLGVAAVGCLVWLVVASDLPPGVRLALAIPAVLVLLLVKPSFGRVPKYGVITECEAHPHPQPYRGGQICPYPALVVLSRLGGVGDFQQQAWAGDHRHGLAGGSA